MEVVVLASFDGVEGKDSNSAEMRLRVTKHYFWRRLFFGVHRRVFLSLPGSSCSFLIFFLAAVVVAKHRRQHCHVVVFFE